MAVAEYEQGDIEQSKVATWVAHNRVIWESGGLAVAFAMNLTALFMAGKTVMIVASAIWLCLTFTVDGWALRRHSRSVCTQCLDRLQPPADPEGSFEKRRHHLRLFHWVVEKASSCYLWLRRKTVEPLNNENAARIVDTAVGTAVFVSMIVAAMSPALITGVILERQIGFPGIITGCALIVTSVAYMTWLGRVHVDLFPWCRFCHPGGGGDDETNPTAPPPPNAEKVLS